MSRSGGPALKGEVWRVSKLTRSMWPIPEVDVPTEDRDRAVLHSTLWAAAADALGWITELSYGEKGVVRRTGATRVDRPVPWKRVIGGRGGPQVRIPAGTYSDDTQLRLGVSRAIRGDGSFDVEAFAKIELTVWPTYALGGGLGSKAAAANLARRGVNWFSNFFDGARQKYVFGGGNGAAMRIQPHVWSSAGNREVLIADVFRNAIVTHGHAHGFCGAIFHALSLDDAIRKRTISSPVGWGAYLDHCLELMRLMEGEPQLSTFWLSEWETKAGITLKDAVARFRDEGSRDIELVQGVQSGSPLERYREVLSKLGCWTPQYRGSGWKTSLAALSLAYFFRENEIEDALITSANELESDTDTIGTMAGALLGATVNRSPMWPVQDCVYLAREAQRLSRVARGEVQDSFAYPDLGHWGPPRKQYEAMGIIGNGLAMAGLGELQTHGEEYSSKGLVWQWCELPFGQNVLAKRKTGVSVRIAPGQLPGERQKAPATSRGVGMAGAKQPNVSGELFGDEHSDVGLRAPVGRKGNTNRVVAGTVDAWTDEVILSNFDDRVLGRMLNRCIDASRSVEAAVGFAAIIAKAKLARTKRRR